MAMIDPKDARIAALEAEVEALKSGITPPKTPMEGGFSLDKFMPGLTADDAAAMGDALDAAEEAACLQDAMCEHWTDIADAGRVIAWARDPNRKPAVTAFTAGPERQAAYWIEWAETPLMEALGKAEEALKSINNYTEDFASQVTASRAISTLSAARQAATGTGTEGRIRPEGPHSAALGGLGEGE